MQYYNKFILTCLNVLVCLYNVREICSGCDTKVFIVGWASILQESIIRRSQGSELVRYIGDLLVMT